MVSVKDCFDSANQIQVSTYAIRILGLICAVYCEELHTISGKADRKSKKKTGKVDTSYMEVNREYIKHRTSISIDEQYKCDVSLKKIGIIDFAPEKPDLIKFDYDSFLKVILNDDCKFLEKVMKQVKVPTAAETKEIAFHKKVDNLKKAVIEDNITIAKLLYTWIDELAETDISKITVSTVKDFQKLVMDYSKSNIKVATRIIQIATAQKWLNAVNAIEIYEREVKVLKSNKPKVSTMKVATKDSVNKDKKY